MQRSETDITHTEWMREYERRRSDLYNAAYDVGDARNGEDEERAEAVAAMARKALDAHVRGLVDALERIAANGCEHIHDGDCLVEGHHSGNYTLDSDEWATRICDSCAARAALATPKDAP